MGSISSAPPLPTASPSACNLCCEERQQRTTYKTFGKSAWFIFTWASWLPNYTGVLAHNVLLQHLIIYFAMSVLLFFCLKMKEENGGWRDGAGKQRAREGCKNQLLYRIKQDYIHVNLIHEIKMWFILGSEVKSLLITTRIHCSVYSSLMLWDMYLLLYLQHKFS